VPDLAFDGILCRIIRAGARLLIVKSDADVVLTDFVVGGKQLA
jgi:hypothetical protein